MAIKKAVFFTIDSLLASGIIITAILLLGNFYYAEHQKANVNYASGDLVRVFSTMPVGESNNEYVKNLISSGIITDINATIMEQIGNFWADNNPEQATNLTKNLTEAIIPSKYGFSVLVNDEEIYSRNIPQKKILISSRQLISGIAKSKPTNGFTSRVLLNGIKSKKTSAYVYFGGYEGDGNLTKKLILPNDVISFNSSHIEVDGSSNFNLYINNIFSGSYAQGSSGGGIMLADKWNISNAYLVNFRAGENTISINFTSGNSYIAGGFLKLTYVTSSYNDTQTLGYQKYLFPGIDGIINLYSSVYVPGTINSIAVFLNYSSPYNIFLTLGNTTIYQGSTNGIKNVTLNNSTLASLLDFSSLSQKTVPLRLGLTNVVSTSSAADAVLISDVSGSMDWCAKISDFSNAGTINSNSQGCYRFFGLWWYDYYNFTPNNGYTFYNRTTWYNGTSNLCGCRWNTICKNDSRKMDVYINSSNQFVDTIYNSSGNRVGIAEFSSTNSETVYANNCSTSSSTTTVFKDGIVRFNNLTTNKSQIVQKLNSTSAYWGTCICCGINKAADLLTTQNNPSVKKYMILMSDGSPTDTCTQQPNSTSTADAVQAAWDACNKNITVYSIGFGVDADTATMKRMNCSGGKYFNATDTAALQQAYTQIAGEINQLTFSEQTANISGTLSRTVIYPDSYIAFNYSVPSNQFNKLPLSFETDRFGNNISSGTMNIYANTSVLDAKVTSYSGKKWTDNLVVNGNTVYRLSDYGSAYQTLGDPFTVNIPVGYINQGSNSITISSGINSTSSSGGSNDDKVIYTLLLNAMGDYSTVVSKSNGCSWTVNFEDGISTLIKIPSNYNGASSCIYSSKTYDTEDALDNAVYQLLSSLDIDKNGKLDVNIDTNNLNVNTLTVSKVPSLWGPAILEIRVWE